MSAARVGPARQAVILAGGKATRLRPYTDSLPKPLIEVAGVTIFERQVRWLHEAGIEQVVVACGYLADVFQSFIADTPLPVKVTLMEEPEPLGRGGALKFATSALMQPDEPWIGLNGDVLTDRPAGEILHHHQAHARTVTLAVARFKCPYGVVELADDDRVVDFTESPVLPYWINAGMYVFEPEATALLPDRGDHEDSTLPDLAAAGRLSAYRIYGYWKGIDNPKDLADAARELPPPAAPDQGA